MSILPLQKGLKILGGGRGLKGQNVRKCMKLNIVISRGVGGLRKNPFHGGGMDIFWNYK